MNHKRSFPFNKAGVSFYINTVEKEIFSALDSGEDIPNISLKIGNNFITIPMIAENFENTINYLKICLEDLEQC